MTTQDGIALVFGNGFTRVEPTALKSNFTPPAGFSAEGDSRKFIVLVASEAENWHLVLVIGPPLDGGSYFHKDLLKRTRDRFPDFKISGGGFCECKWSSYDKKWTVRFSGQSGDFGVYDPKLLDARLRAALAVELDMPCRFEWQG